VGRVSIIVPTLNEENHVGSLLSDVAEQTREPDEIMVVDGLSKDGTVSVVERFPNVDLLIWSPPVASQRNLGGRQARGEVLVFLDADVRLPRSFLEDFLEEFERRHLDIACPLYMPYRSTLAINLIHVFFNAVFVVFQKVLPSGAGHCIVIKREAFQRSRGFDPSLKFDDIELIRRLSKKYRFGIVNRRISVSDRRYGEYGVLRMFLRYLLMSSLFATGRFDWANRIDYEFGSHGRQGR
jgi:glycosyltransferase involved in cell wall biosynthesis